MKLANTIPGLRLERQAFSGTLGLVPTMGCLHEGHLSLVQRAHADNDHVAVSIFVNPTQFGPFEDLTAYPRDLQRDLTLLQQEEVDLVWAPVPEEVYPPSFQTKVEVTGLTSPLEGAHRPGHLLGVTTVVAKLLNIFTPDRVYLGQKDAQQARVIRQLVADLNFALEVVVCPTMREPDGLAMSSRNTYLSKPQRRAATVLFRGLSAASQAFSTGERDADVLRAIMAASIDTEPLAKEQYVSAADPDTLRELDYVHTHVLLSMAIQIGSTRLIDNTLLTTSRNPASFAT